MTEACSHKFYVKILGTTDGGGAFVREKLLVFVKILQYGFVRQMHAFVRQTYAFVRQMYALMTPLNYSLLELLLISNHSQKY